MTVHVQQTEIDMYTGADQVFVACSTEMHCCSDNPNQSEQYDNVITLDISRHVIYISLNRKPL